MKHNAKPGQKLPWMKFYWRDWLVCPELNACSLGAQGMWMRLLCAMRDSQPLGHLCANGVPMDERAIARLVGATAAECKRYLGELERNGVFARVADGPMAGAIYSRRMAREEEQLARDRENGAKSLNNPRVPRPRDSGDIPRGYPGGISTHPIPQGIPTETEAETEAETDNSQSNLNTTSGHAKWLWDTCVAHGLTRREKLSRLPARKASAPSFRAPCSWSAPGISPRAPLTTPRPSPRYPADSAPLTSESPHDTPCETVGNAQP